ncbi:unnamed protein product [Brassicogethes aeneus]|uniref:NADP-dependent oxidoreductase domain-containing protein n=1 Tax=Brassicogethes aeneus TaxID=1431903 RepID=A0A9P0B3N2_BRAAE|nr:unnamed protein product [Brassicogethes aeneus]
MAGKKYIDIQEGNKMPIVGLGTWQCTNEEELVNALDVALEIGYRHIDTAYAYGNEQIIGKVLKKWFDSGKLKREDLFITTKLPLFAIKADKVEEMIKASLKSLDVDYVDLYLIHFPVYMKLNDGEIFSRSEKTYETEVTDHLAVWKKMEEQVRAGRTKAIGVSNFNIRQIDRILKNSEIKPANLQVELHVQLQQRELVKFCQDNGVSVTAYSPLGSPGYNKFLESFGKPVKPIPDLINDLSIKKIAKKHEKTNAQVLLRYTMQRNVAVIPKSINPNRLKENFDVFDFSLDEDDVKIINDMEVGEAARVCDCMLFPGLEKNVEFPFPR